MAKLRIATITKEYSQSANGDVLVATCEIFDKDDVLEIRKLEFALETTKKEMTEELKRYIDTYNTDEKRKVENEAYDKAQEKADKLIEDLTGVEI